MSAPPVPYLAHIASDVSWTTTHTVLVAVAGALLAALVVEHLYVKHGHLHIRHFRAPLAAVLALSLAAVAAPTPSFAQSSVGAMGLPDLISDPPFIWIEQIRTHPVDGEVIRTLDFDGFLHNIGTGALDLAGNPQIEGGVKQRVFDGTQWEDVGEPLVRFETDDGHNHFHLMNASAYSLWNEAQTEEVNIGDKVGFCLLDTRQVERGVDAAYLIDEINYCNVDEPESTDLRMGISPGWVDIYEANVTFQWIDVSNTLPGRYWVGSIIDPNNEIVESNEDNNGLVFSANKYAVSGYNARELPVQTPGEIMLKSTAFGTAGQLAYVIVDPPEHGTLSVPAGYDLHDPIVEYAPDDGYSGSDSFSYYAHDTNVPFPFDPHIVTVDIQVDEPLTTAPVVLDGDGDLAIVTDQTDFLVTRYDRLSIEMSVDGAPDTASVRWFAKDLPAGLTIDPATGQIDGELTMPHDAAATVMARIAGVDVTTDLNFTIADAPRPSLRAVNNFSTILERRDLVVGSGSAETTYRASGLPPGVVMQDGQPTIVGTPTEMGNFDIVVVELLDGAVVDTVKFTMTVRPAARPQFPL